MKNFRILVVDDEGDSVEIMRMILENEGYKVYTASDGHEVLLKASQQKPDLIFLDIRMPNMDGCEVCRRLKSQPETKMIPVIMHTASGSERSSIMACEAGADDFMLKPFTIRKLVDIAKKHLGDR